MTWFETIAGNQRTCSRASARSAPMWLGAQTMHSSSDGSRPASSAARRAVSMIHWMICGSASWMMTPSAIRPATERARPVAGDVERDARLGAGPRQLQLLVVPGDRLAVHQRLDHPARLLEPLDLDRLEPDHAARGVAAADAHDHPAAGDDVPRGVRAREH